MSSDRGMLSPAHSAAYCITKHGVQTFSDVLRAEMKRFGVAVSIIQPGHFGAATAIINPQAVSVPCPGCSHSVLSSLSGRQKMISFAS